MIAEVLTPWTGDGATYETRYQPKVALDYGCDYSDVTSQDAANVYPDPNLYSVLIECDEATLTAIRNDNNYWVVWWAEE